VASIAAFTSQRLRQQHAGSSLRTIISLLENRHPVVRKLLFSGISRPSVFSDAESRPSVLLSAEALRTTSGFAFESLSHAVASRFRSFGAKAPARFGVVHASLGSLSSAALALRSPRRVSSPFAGAGFSFPATLVTVQHDAFSARLQKSPFLSNTTNFAHVHAGTHRPSRRLSANTSLLPATSLYEQKGRRVVLEGPGGRVRSHSVTTTRPTNSRSIEALWSALCRMGSDSV